LTVGAGGTFIFDRMRGASSVVVSPGAAAVPEPSTFVLLVAEAIGFGWWRKRKAA
jgi:hypothetical protein